MTIVGTIKVLGHKILTRVSETKLDDYGIKTIKTSGTSSIIEQVLNYFKEIGFINFDRIWVSSENFSHGSAVRVHTLNSDEKSKRFIRKICDSFEFGSFNPIVDRYEYKSSSEELEFIPNEQYNIESEFYPMKVGVKYVSFENKPPYGTREYYTTFPPVEEILSNITIRKVA
tara:strand:+ start:1469 stop:1984 length:516 start_codon:yes stop_codon:yes gene_type:complete